MKHVWFLYRINSDTGETLIFNTAYRTNSAANRAKRRLENKMFGGQSFIWVQRLDFSQ